MITLYYAPDNASLIIRIVLEELAIDHETVLVDRSENQQQSDAYLKLNPNGLIPVCIIDGQPVFETAAIALTLADRANSYGGDAAALCTPGINSADRPQFLKWLFFASNTLHPDLRQLFYPQKFVGADSSSLDGFNALTFERIKQNLTIIDTQYGLAATDYLFGDKPSIFDIYVAICVRWLQLYPTGMQSRITFDDYPSLHAMLVLLQVRPAVVAACAAEGIRGSFLTNSDYANPVVGSAT